MSHKAAWPPLLYDMRRMALGSRQAMNIGVPPIRYMDTIASCP